MQHVAGARSMDNVASAKCGGMWFDQFRPVFLVTAAHAYAHGEVRDRITGRVLLPMTGQQAPILSPSRMGFGPASVQAFALGTALDGAVFSLVVVADLDTSAMVEEEHWGWWGVTVLGGSTDSLHRVSASVGYGTYYANLIVGSGWSADARDDLDLPHVFILSYADGAGEASVDGTVLTLDGPPSSGDITSIALGGEAYGGTPAYPCTGHIYAVALCRRPIIGADAHAAMAAEFVRRYLPSR